MSKYKAPTFQEFRAMSNEQIGAVIRKFMDDNLDAVMLGAHSTSFKLAISGDKMMKILTDDYDKDWD